MYAREGSNCPCLSTIAPYRARSGKSKRLFHLVGIGFQELEDYRSEPFIYRYPVQHHALAGVQQLLVLLVCHI